ncbi:MAG: phage holin family protein [Cyanobacteria bacterium]|nr:phage holin family protein [Cyanobacteriota bacterium]
MSHSLAWMLQWPVRALILLLVSRMPLGVDMISFRIALVSSLVIAFLGTLLVWPLRLLLAPLKMVTTLGGLLPVGFLFEWLISAVLFAATAWLIQGFKLRYGLGSAFLGALVYSIISFIALKMLGLQVPLLRP